MSEKRYRNENIEANIRHYMKERGMSQQALAEKIFCSVTAVNQYISGGRRLDQKNLELIAEALEVSVEDLLAERTGVDYAIFGLAEDISDETLPEDTRKRYADETYSAIPAEESRRILLEENAKRELGEYIVSHPKAYVLIGILTAISVVVFLFYPEVHSRIYSGIVMCGLAMLIGKSIKKRRKIDKIMDVALLTIMVTLIILFVVSGIMTARQ